MPDSVEATCWASLIRRESDPLSLKLRNNAASAFRATRPPFVRRRSMWSQESPLSRSGAAAVAGQT